MTAPGDGVSSEDGEVVLVTDRRGRILGAGGPTRDLFGVDGRDLLFVDLRAVMSPADRARLLGAMSDAVRHCTTTRVPVAVGSGRTRRPVLVAVGPPARDDDGRIQRWVLRVHERAAEAPSAAALLPAPAEAEPTRRDPGPTEVSPLERALARGEIGLDYQPIVALAGRQVVCVEGLVRWRRPGGVSLRPRSFLAQAERFGLMDQVLRRVVFVGCEALTGAAGPVPPALAINVSTPQLVHPAFFPDLEWAIERTGIEPHRLVLELTGIDTGADLEAVEGLLHRAVERIGVRLALDNVGAATMSVGALTRFPADTVKIDRSLVIRAARPDGTREREAVVGLVELAHRLGCAVVAEGVETDAQLTMVRSAGITLAQGFLLGRPGPLVPGTAEGYEPTAAQVARIVDG